MNNLLSHLLSIQGDHDNEKAMVDYIFKFIRKIPNAKIDSDEHGNLIVTKRTNKNVEFLPSLACHLDTVHKTDPNYKVLFYDDMYFTPPNCRAGVGGDDRCGIFICLTLLKELPDVKVFFFTGEEVGCIGSNAIDLKVFDKCRFIIEPDRKDSSDLISTYSGQDTGGKEFMTLLDVARNMGFKDAVGVYTDVMTLLDRDLEISVLNLSCGYYKAHTQYEYVIQSEVMHTLDTVREICKKSEDMIYFNDRTKYQPIEYNYPAYDSSKADYYNNDDDDDDYWKYGDWGRPYSTKDRVKDKKTVCEWCYTKHNAADLIPYKSYKICKDCEPYTTPFK